VSSLVRTLPPGVRLRIPSFGPTAFTFAPGQLEARPGGRHVLAIGVGYDHYAFGGIACVRYLDALGEILSAEDVTPFL
jgi:hypothetical protein